MKSIYFFALKEDLETILNLVEADGPLSYALCGNFLKKEAKGVQTFSAGIELPNLGKADGDSSTLCDDYLVHEKGTRIKVENFRGNDGPRYCVDQLVNPDTVAFRPGGKWSMNVIIAGYVGTASDSEPSQRLMKRFRTAIRKTFTKVEAFHVGPRAFERLEKGARLTSSARSPREFDLTVS